MNPSRRLYVFLDESGNFDFSPRGSRFFVLTSVTKERPFVAPHVLHDLRYDLLESGAAVAECFHATEDRQVVRNAVYEVIRDHLDGVRVDSLIIEKAKTRPALREVERFYPMMLGYLLEYVLRSHVLTDYAEVLIFLAALHTGKQRTAMEKAIKQTLSAMLPRAARYRLVYHASKANFDLQITDYCTWAIAKKWDHAELRPYEIIRPAIRSEFDFFRNGSQLYY